MARRISRLQIETSAASNNDILVVEAGNFVFKNLANVYAGISPNSNVEGNIRFTSATSINLNANGANGGAVVVQNSALRLRSYSTGNLSSLTAVEGDLVYNNTTKTLQFYNGTVWANV